MDSKGTLNNNDAGKVVLGLITLTNAVAYNNIEKGWRQPTNQTPIYERRPISELIALLHSEVTEAFEAYRNNEPALWYEHSTPGFVGEPFSTMPSLLIEGEDKLGKPQGIASELADVLIRLLDMADEHEIPLVQAVLDKHKYNQTRPYRHGGKVV